MKKIWLGIFFLIPFYVYLYTLHPTVSPYRDSGDLIVAASTLGIAHPPGYPLYVLTGKIFITLFKFANSGYVMNVMSAFFAALGVYFLSLAIFEISGSSFACASVLFLAFSQSYWRLAQVSEMYSLNAFFASLLIYFAVLKFYSKDGLPKPSKASSAFFLSFLSGLAFANHPTIVFMLPGIFWLVYRSGDLEPKDYLYALLFFAAGASIDLFILIRASTHPLSDWGKPENLTNFLRVITRSDYGGLKLHPEQSKFSWTTAIIIGHLLVFLKSLADQFTMPAALIGAWGMFLKRKDKFYQMLFISLVISGPLFIILSNLSPSEKTTLPILEPHLLMPDILFAFFMAAGVNKLLDYGATAKVALLVLVIVFFLFKLPLCSYREHFYAYDYGKNILKTTPPGSIIYDPDDPTAFITTYMQDAMSKRPDIKLAAYFRTRWGYELLKERRPEILPARDIPSGQELARELLDFNRSRWPVLAELPGKFPAGYLSYPVGLLYRLSAKNEFTPSAVPFEMYSFHNPCLKNDSYDFFTNQVISYYSSAENNIGLSMVRLQKYDDARQQYMAALAIDPDLEATFNNMGSLEFSIKNYDNAEKWFLMLLKTNGESASALYNIGITYRAMKRNEDAARYIRRAWDKYSYPDAGNELGLIALESGNAALAGEMFRAIINVYPGYLLAYYNMGLSEKALGNYAESRKYFQIYLNNTSDASDRKDTLRIINSLPDKQHTTQ